MRLSAKRAKSSITPSPAKSSSTYPISLRPSPRASSLLSSVLSKVNVRPHRGYINRAAVGVVSRMRNLRTANHSVKAVPDMGVVIPLHDVLATVAQAAVAQQKPQSAVMQIILVVALDRVRNIRHAHFVVFPMPALPAVVAAEQDCLPNLGVDK